MDIKKHIQSSYSYYLLLSILLGFASCSKDDSDSDTSKKTQEPDPTVVVSTGSQ